MGLGYDEGTVLIKIGREEPVASMDTSGKIIWARHNEVQTVNVKSLGSDFEEVSRLSCLLSCHPTPVQLFRLAHRPLVPTILPVLTRMSKIGRIALSKHFLMGLYQGLSCRDAADLTSAAWQAHSNSQFRKRPRK